MATKRPTPKRSVKKVPAVKTCEHIFVVLDSIFRQVNKKSHITGYQRVDFFFCQKCLIQEEIRKEIVVNGTGTIPDWYDAKRTYVISELGM